MDRSSILKPTRELSLEHERLVFALAMQSSRMGAWERDLIGETVWWSHELEAIFGLEEGEFGGTEEHFFEFIYEADRPIAFREVQAAMKERRPFQYEFRFKHRNGTIRWMEGRGQATYSETGEPQRLYGVGIDITQRKTAEEKASLLTSLNDAVQKINDPAEVMSVTARTLGEHLEVDRCAYAEVEDESVFVITGDYTRGVPSIVGRWDVAAFGSECVRCMMDNVPYVVSDSETDDRISDEDVIAYRATKIRSAICLPLQKNGRFTAAMAVHRQDIHSWSENEIEIVKLVVNRCWESLERTRAARRIRESEERFRLALSSGAVTVYEQDTELRYRWIYPDIYGDKPIGHTDLELTPGPSGETLTLIKQRVLASRESIRTEVTATVDGEDAWFDLLVEPRFTVEGELAGVGGTALNITDRKKLEVELLGSEARFRGLMEQAPMSIQLYDRTGRHVQVNKAWEELWGLQFADIPDYNVLEDPQLEAKGIAPILRQVFSGVAAELPLIEYNPDETLPGKSKNPKASRWVSAIAYPLKDGDGNVREVALVHQDVTKQKVAERELVFQKTVLESLSESVLDGILIVSPTGEMLHHNQRFVDIWNFPPEVVESKSDDAALEWAAAQTSDPKEFLERVRAVYDAPKEPAREEVEMLDGRVFERFGAPVFHGETRLGWVWTFRDITDRKRVEHALETRVAERTSELARTNEMLVIEMEERARSEQERLDLLKQIFTVQEAERGRIARDIHDQLGQRITALRFKTTLMRDACGDNPQLAAQADELQEIALRLDHEVSFVAWELRPSILDDLNFSDALENFVIEWSRHSGIPAEFHATGIGEPTIGRDVETNMYRIVQEALNNAAKHSRATAVNVLLERRTDGITLIVEDNGIGIDERTNARREGLKGLGLLGMRERASLVGGTLEIESSEAGTSLFIRIPFSSSDADRTPALV